VPKIFHFSKLNKPKDGNKAPAGTVDVDAVATCDADASSIASCHGLLQLGGPPGSESRALFSSF